MKVFPLTEPQDDSKDIDSIDSLVDVYCPLCQKTTMFCYDYSSYHKGNKCFDVYLCSNKKYDHRLERETKCCETMTFNPTTYWLELLERHNDKH